MSIEPVTTERSSHGAAATASVWVTAAAGHRLHDRGDPVEGLAHAGLIVDRHHADDRRVFVEERAQRVEIDHALVIDVEEVRVHRLVVGGERSCRIENCVVLDLGDDQLGAIVTPAVVMSHPGQRQETRLAAPAGKDHATGFGAQVAATSSRASSTARRASRAARWLPEGLPTIPCCQRAIASLTASRRGADAA